MGAEIRPQPGIMDIALYVGGASHAEGHTNVLKLSANENPFGPSEKAKEAYSRAGHTLHRYPGTDHESLRTAIAEVHGAEPDRILCGVGSDEIIHFLCQAYAGPGDEVVHTAHGFAMYRISALAAGATPVEVPEKDRVVDVDAVLAACTARTRLVFITNPGNPTATLLGQNEMARLAEGLPPQVLLVLDAAYAEYAGEFDGGLALVSARDNVLMTRTLSKIYGLGGLRIGWCYGPRDVIDVLNRVRGPFNLSGPALATAEAAVRDQDWVRYCRTENARWRDWMAHALAEMGVPSDTSTTNFILARFASATEAVACNDYLTAQGILVRYPRNYGFPDCLRITVGDEASCRRVVHAIGQFKGQR